MQISDISTQVMTLSPIPDSNVWGGIRYSRPFTPSSQLERVSYTLVVKEAGLIRFGFSTGRSKLALGTDVWGWGYGSTGKKSHGGKFEDFGRPWEVNDRLHAHLLMAPDLSATVAFAINDEPEEVAYHIPSHLVSQGLFAHVCLKAGVAELHTSALADLPLSSSSTAAAPSISLEKNGKHHQNNQKKQKNQKNQKKTRDDQMDVQSDEVVEVDAILLAPTRELVLQSATFCEDLANSVNIPLQVVSLLGGVQLPKGQSDSKPLLLAGSLQRIVDETASGRLDLSRTAMLIVDEADAIGNTPSQMRQLTRLWLSCRASNPQVQMGLFSATLHDPRIRSFCAQQLPRAMWVDLKGKNIIPSSVWHGLVLVDGSAEQSGELEWADSDIQTDGVHLPTVLSQQDPSSPDNISQRIKSRKGTALLQVLETIPPKSQAMLFVRTRLDADNLQTFLGAHGHPAIALHAGKDAGQRKKALAAFQMGEISLLIATDVAARGIDIPHLPLVVNVTMPETAAEYAHRVGRVGRGSATGRAISLLALQPEVVWYHTCPSRGKHCEQRWDKNEGGCTTVIEEASIWSSVLDMYSCNWNEWRNVEREWGAASQRLRHVPVGSKQSHYVAHTQQLKEQVQRLAQLEREAQRQFLGVP
mgnify:FL=1